MSLTPVVHAFGLARAPGDPSEDAYAVDAAAGRIALADGASSAWRAGDWAAALVAAWVAAPPTPGRGRSGGGQQGALERWRARQAKAFTAQDAALVDQPWFTAAAAARGAHAAFLGLLIDGLDDVRLRWRTSAVGDVCGFHVRDDRLLVATPLDAAGDFTSRPDLLSSLPEAGTPSVVTEEGRLDADDMLVLASDALAGYLLRLDAAGEPVWATVRRLDRGAFRTFVVAGVDAGLLERDDVTLVRVVLAGEDDGEVPA